MQMCVEALRSQTSLTLIKYVNVISRFFSVRRGDHIFDTEHLATGFKPATCSPYNTYAAGVEMTCVQHSWHQPLQPNVWLHSVDSFNEKRNITVSFPATRLTENKGMHTWSLPLLPYRTFQSKLTIWQLLTLLLREMQPWCLLIFTAEKTKWRHWWDKYVLVYGFTCKMSLNERNESHIL